MLRLAGSVCAAVAILLVASGCTWQQAAYNVGQAWQRGSCTRLPEQAERDRCLSNTNMSYEEYRRKTEGTTRQQDVRAEDAATPASRPPLRTPQADGSETSHAQ